MIGTGVRLYAVDDPRHILEYGMFNASLWGILFFVILNTRFSEQPFTNILPGLLVAVAMYAMYMLNQHRRMFVLHKAPSRLCIFAGGYVGSDADFWRFCKDAEVTSEQLEVSFWRHFWIPPVLCIVFFFAELLTR